MSGLFVLEPLALKRVTPTSVLLAETSSVVYC